MHIGGMGPEEKLATAAGKVFARIKETSSGKGTIPHADLDPSKTSLDPRMIEAGMPYGDLPDDTEELPQPQEEKD